MSERDDYWIECDGCGRESGHYGAPWKAQAEVKDDGWLVVDSSSYPKHYCCECQQQGKNPEATAGGRGLCEGLIKTLVDIVVPAVEAAKVQP